MNRSDRTYLSATGWPSGAMAASTAEASSSREGLESGDDTRVWPVAGEAGSGRDTLQTANRLAALAVCASAVRQIQEVALTVFDSAWYLPKFTQAASSFAVNAGTCRCMQCQEPFE